MKEKIAAPLVLPVFKNVKTTTLGSKIVFDFAMDNTPADLTSFKIAYGKNADSLTQEVTTMPLDKITSTMTPG